jgi:membrane protein
MIGPTVTQLFEKLNLFDKSKLNKFEIISLEMMIGLLFMVIYMFIIGFIGIKYSFKIFIPLIVNSFYQMIRILVSLFKSIKIKNKKIDYVNIILMLVFLIWILYYSFNSMTSNNIFPDEYAVWLLNPKNIFIGKRMNFFINTGLEIYPNFLPLLSSGFYFFINKIDENSVRIFSSVFMFICGIGLIGYCKRRNISTVCLMVLIIYMFINYFIVNSIICSTYGDIAFMVTYTLGMVYFFDWIIYRDCNETLIISTINLMCYSFIKTEALYILAFNILLLFIIKLFFKQLKVKKINFKIICLYTLAITILPLAWKLYSIIAKFPSRVIIGNTGTINNQYMVSMLTNMSSQLFECMPWVIVLIILLVGISIYGSKINSKDWKFILLGVITIIANICFLVICYLTIFGAEGLTAASYIRYMTRVFLIMVLISLVSIKPFYSNK